MRTYLVMIEPGHGSYGTIYYLGRLSGKDAQKQVSDWTKNRRSLGLQSDVSRFPRIVGKPRVRVYIGMWI